MMVLWDAAVAECSPFCPVRALRTTQCKRLCPICNPEELTLSSEDHRPCYIDISLKSLIQLDEVAAATPPLLLASSDTATSEASVLPSDQMDEEKRHSMVG